MNVVESVCGGLWGLLVGDALGVPYEFHAPGDIPAFDEIDMVPPSGYARTYLELLPGTWSDDGAQALCLLDSLLEKGRLDIDDLALRLVAWEGKGLWAVDGYVFDRGIQTLAAINLLRAGVSPRQSGFVKPAGKGNGSLMRVLPLALWHQGSDAELIEDAHLQSVVTHGHVTNQVCCALYCVWARRMLEGGSDGRAGDREGLAEAAYEDAVRTLRAYYGASSDYREMLETEVRPEERAETTGSDGSGYVVATLHAARLALREPTYEAVVKKAIGFGKDTDTNAAVAGGLAGVRDGIDGIPRGWLEQLRGKDLAGPLLDRLVAHRSR